ncbi:MAG: glycosyltransferase family 87 protein, partial [bacterium]
VIFTCAGFWAMLGNPFSVDPRGFLYRGFLINVGKNEVDFACYYSAALAARWGYPMHNSGPYALLQPNVLRNTWKPEDGDHAKPENVYLYPAMLAYSLVPLTFFAYSTAELIWNLSCLAVYAWGVYLFIRCVRSVGDRSRIWTAIIIILSLVWPLFLVSVQHGQVVPWIFLLLAFCLWGLIVNRPYVAGISLGLAMALKLGPAVYVPYLLIQKRWRVAGVAVATFLVLLCVGPTHNARLFRWVLPHLRLGSTLLSNQCLNGVLCRTQTNLRERWITPEGYEEIQGDVRTASWIGAAALVLALIGARSGRDDPEALIASFALMAVTLAVFSPLSRATEYTYALFGLGILVKWWLESPRRGQILIGIPLALMVALSVFDLGGVLMRCFGGYWAWWVSVNATFIWGLTLWFILAAGLFLRRERPSSGSED